MAKRLVCVLLILALLAGLAACGDGSPPPVSDPLPPAQSLPDRSAPGQEAPAPFTLAFSAQDVLHPARCTSRVNLALAPLLYEGLFALDADFRPQKVLCDTFQPGEDGLSWTFTLREGITFSDGTPLTASAAAQSLELARTCGGSYAGRLADVESVTGYRDGRLVITLTRPNARLPALLDIPICLGSGDRPLGTGAYVLEEDEQGLPLALRLREDRHQQTQGLPEEIRLLCAEHSDDLIHGFNGGEITLVDADPSGTGALGYSAACGRSEYETSEMVYLAFNTAQAPFRTAEARRAVCAALDREELCRESYGGLALPSRRPVPPGAWLAGETSPAAPLSGEERDGLFARSRLAGKSVRLIVNSENTDRVRAARQAAGQLEQALGVTVQVDVLAWNDYTAALAAGEFDLYLAQVKLTADFDLTSLLSTAGALNYGAWSDEETDGLLLQFSATGDAGDAQALYDRLDAQAPIAPLCFRLGCVLTQWGRLSGLNPLQGNVFYRMEDWSFS